MIGRKALWWGKKVKPYHLRGSFNWEHYSKVLIKKNKDNLVKK